MKLEEAFGVSVIKGLMIFGAIIILSLNQSLNNAIKIALWLGCWIVYVLVEAITLINDRQRRRGRRHD